jgi:hypothetical protein
MKAARIVVGLAALAGIFAQGGCSSSCGPTSDRLAALRRGMSYDEASAVMGCPGTVLTADNPASGTFSTVEWKGPATRLFGWTQLDFLDGKLLSYSTGLHGAL